MNAFIFHRVSILCSSSKNMRSSVSVVLSIHTIRSSQLFNCCKFIRNYRVQGITMDKGTHKEPSPSSYFSSFHKHHIENHNESPSTNYTPIVINKLNNTEDNPVVINENYISATVYTDNNMRIKARIKDNPIQKISIIDSDLRETFIKGRGPGGQKINKTNNCVQLLHIPTGIIINYHIPTGIIINYYIYQQVSSSIAKRREIYKVIVRLHVRC